MHRLIRHWTIIAVALGIILSTMSCSQRERTNPFDPNGSTNSDVFNLHVKSDPGEVILTWAGFQSPDLTGYNIYRAQQGIPLQQIGQIDENSSRFVDQSIEIGHSYIYGITAIGEADESPLSRLDTITPGNSRWWVLSADYSPVSELSHDGLHRYASYDQPYYNPDFIAPVGKTTAYIYDPFGGTIYKQTVGEPPEKFMDDIDYLNDLFYNPDAQKLVAIYRLNNQKKLLLISIPSGDISEVVLDNAIRAVTQDSQGRLWAATSAGLYRIFPTNLSVRQITQFDNNFRVINLENGPDDRPYLIADNHNAIYQLQSNASVDSVGFVTQPIELRYDDAKNLLWIRAFDDESGQYRVEQFDGQQVRRVLDKLKNTYSFDVNPVSHVCLISDYDTRIVYTITPEGEIRHRKDIAGRIYYTRAQSLE